MSKSATPTPVTATRRQLDELEALLQRMLELPVQPTQDDLASTNDLPQQAAVKIEETAPSWEEQARAEDAGAYAVPVYQWEQSLESPPPVRENLLSDRLSWQRSVVESETAAKSEPASERSHPGEVTASDPSLTEPGIIRLLLGWSGLLLLVISLVIILLEWFGWTW